MQNTKSFLRAGDFSPSLNPFQFRFAIVSARLHSFEFSAFFEVGNFHLAASSRFVISSQEKINYINSRFNRVAAFSRDEWSKVRLRAQILTRNEHFLIYSQNMPKRNEEFTFEVLCQAFQIMFAVVLITTDKHELFKWLQLSFKLNENQQTLMEMSKAQFQFDLTFKLASGFYVNP